MLQFWDKKTPLTYSTGRVATPAEVIADYPSMATIKTVLEVSGGVTVMMMPLPVAIQRYDLDESMGDAAMLEAIAEGLARDRDPDYSAINEMLDGLEQEDDE